VSVASTTAPGTTSPTLTSLANVVTPVSSIAPFQGTSGGASAVTNPTGTANQASPGEQLESNNKFVSIIVIVAAFVMAA